MKKMSACESAAGSADENAQTAFAEGDQTPLFAVSLRGAGYGNRVVEVVGSKWWIAWKE
jgi:hypothetical protein